MTAQNDRNIAAADQMIERRNTLALFAGQADAMAALGPRPKVGRIVIQSAETMDADKTEDDSIPALLLLIEEQRIKLRGQNSSMRRMETWMAHLAGRIEKLEARNPPAPPLFPDDAMGAEMTAPDDRPFDELAEQEQTPYHDKAAEILIGLHWCTRVWEAWNVGTMTRDDFVRADEDDEIFGDTAKALYDFVQAQR